MGTKQQILIGHFTDGKSARALSRELGLHRKTVTKYINEHKATLGRDDPAIPAAGIIDPPRYRSRGRPRRVLTAEVTGRIDELLALNAERRRQGLHKQQLKRVDIHDRLRDEGHDVGYTTVCNYVKERLARGQEAFIRQDYVPGQSVEFDWGEVQLTIGGKTVRFLLAVLTSAYSDFRFARLYDRQNMTSLLDAHVRYFAVAGGVPGELVYDNMRTAVATLAQRNADKQPTEALASLAAYYGFRIRFCNVRRGNEKGNVERSVEYVRRKAFSLTVDFADLAAANAQLQATLTTLNDRKAKGKTDTIRARMDEERAVMKALPPRPYDTAEISTGRVDKYGCVSVDTNHYSVPDEWVGRFVEVRAYAAEVRFYSRHGEAKLLARHDRLRARHQWVIELDHFLPTLRRKPGALLGSAAWKQAEPRLKSFFERHFAGRPRAFVDLLLWARDHDAELSDLIASADRLLSLRPHLPVDADAIRADVRARTQQQSGGQGAMPDSAPLFSPDPAPASAPLSDTIAAMANAQLAGLQQLFSHPSTAQQ